MSFLIYVVAAVAWDVLSDKLLKHLLSNADDRIHPGMIKDSGFAILTGGLLYAALTRVMGKWERALEQRRLAEISKHAANIERKQAEEALQESQAKFARLFRSSPIAMALSTTREDRYLDVNDEFLRLVQRDRDEVVGHTAVEIGVWYNANQRSAVGARVAAQNPVRNTELEICGRTGPARHILWSAELEEIGGESCLLGSALDITQRQCAEQALLENEVKFRAIFDNIAVATAVVGLDNNILMVNDEYCHASG
ncbi:MAG: PAS domain S-box protein [Verrucomicrobiota bacterium]